MTAVLLHLDLQANFNDTRFTTFAMANCLKHTHMRARAHIRATAHAHTEIHAIRENKANKYMTIIENIRRYANIKENRRKCSKTHQISKNQRTHTHAHTKMRAFFLNIRENKCTTLREHIKEDPRKCSETQKISEHQQTHAHAHTEIRDILENYEKMHVQRYANTSKQIYGNV